MTPLVCGLDNAESILLSDIPEYPLERFTEILAAMTRSTDSPARLCALFGLPETRPVTLSTPLRLIAVLAGRERLGVLMTQPLSEQTYPSITLQCPQAHLFEREIAEQWGLTPEGHPWLKPLRFQNPEIHRGARKDPFHRISGKPTVLGAMDFFKILGDDMHAVSLGPVYGDLTEPVHYRFQFCGDKVYFLETVLGYQSRQIEGRFIGGPYPNTLHLAEMICGDSAVGHVTACVQNMEALGEVLPSPRGIAIRGILLELERIAMHVSCTATLAETISYFPTVIHCKRIRDEVMDIIGHIAGNRLGRHILYPGGVSSDISETFISAIGVKLSEAVSDYNLAAGLLFDTPSALRKFRCGHLTRDFCEQYGILGIPARAVGIAQDVRAGYPTGIYAEQPYIPITEQSGDVGARMRLRWLEVQTSASYILNTLVSLPDSPPSSFDSDCLACQLNLQPDALSVSLVEGGRGMITHVVATDSRGKILQYKIVDPSFMNFFGLNQAVRSESIAGFPMIQASFDLSCCGHDL